MGAYKNIGIDIKKIRQSHRSIGKIIESTYKLKNEIKVIKGFNHYAGIIKTNEGTLAMHTDGVGTKVLVACMMKKYDTIGIDCVAMNVNDIICVGATPISFVDYIAANKNDKKILTKIMSGIRDGAVRSSTPIIGGETAIMPDLILGNDFMFDLAGTVIGIVNKNIMVRSINIDDDIIGIKSTGLHSNGYSLVRKILLSKYSIYDKIKNIGILGDELLTPTEIYVKPVLEILNKCNINGLAHITGGAFTKLLRLKKIGFNLDQMPKIPHIMKLIKEEGSIKTNEMYKTFNMGIGLCVMLPKTETKKAMLIFKKHKMKSQKIGNIISKKGVFINYEKIE